MGLQVDDINFLFRDVENDDFLFVDLSEEVDAVGVGPFVKDFSTFIEMDDALILSWFVHSDSYKGLFEGDGDAEDFVPFGIEFDRGGVFEPH